MTPIRHFVSHHNLDRDAVVALEIEMRRRGLASWRDRKDQHRGVKTDLAVLRAIEVETDGFVIYGSPKILGSDYVWNHEWPPAFLRNQGECDRDHPFPYPLTPLFVRGVKPEDLKKAATEHGRPAPAKFNGERLEEGDGASRRTVANHLLRTALKRRTAELDGPLRLHLNTFVAPDGLDTDILVDWADEFAPGAEPPWDDLLAARDDLKTEIARTGRALEMTVQSRLGPAFAFGHAFPVAAKIRLRVGGDGWALGAREDPVLVTAQDVSDAVGDPQVAVVEASLTRKVNVAAEWTVAALGLRPSRILRLDYGPGIEAVDAAVAAAASAAFGRRLRMLRDDGITEAHIFLAGPAPLALLLGASVNAGPAMTLYHSSDGHYVRSVRLGA